MAGWVEFMSELQSKKKKKRERAMKREEKGKGATESGEETLTERQEAVHRSWTLGSSRLVSERTQDALLSLLSQLLAGSGQSTRAEAMGEPVKREFSFE